MLNSDDIHTESRGSESTRSEEHPQPHGLEAPLEAAFEGGKGQRRLGHKAGLLQKHAPRTDGHRVQEAGHLRIGLLSLPLY